MKKILTGAAIAAAMTASAVSAQSASPAAASGRIEAIVGYDRVNSGLKADGVVAGVGVGVDVPVGGVLSIGVDAEASLATTKVDLTSADRFSAGRDLYLGGRLSGAVAPNTTLYVKAGYTNARANYRGTLGDISENDGGWRVGTGVNVGVGAKGFIGGEYRYSDYGDDSRRHQLVAKIGTRF